MRLVDPVGSVPMIGPSYAEKLKKLNIHSVGDLLYHVPSRYVDFTHTEQIGSLQIGKQVTIQGQIVSMQSIRTNRGKVMQIAKISDGQDSVDAIWMNQPYVVKMLPLGTLVSLSGKLSFWGKKRVFSFPQFEKILEGKDSIHTGKLIPIYPETANISSKWLRGRIRKALELTNPAELNDYLSSSTKKALALTSLRSAIVNIHQPKNSDDAKGARKRLAFDELLTLNVSNNLEKIKWRKNNKSVKINSSDALINNFLSSVSFTLTPSQKRTINEIREDFNKNYAMNRLLEGDVGSGKTVIAAAAAYLTSKSGYKTLLMAPTQILASQHYATLSTLLRKFDITCSLVIGGSKKTSESLNADVIIGTHALLHQEIFKEVGLVVVDEQHRFGVKQRAQIATSAYGKLHPHMLTMTATPIPRTVALTLYGDLELSTLDELPKGRRPITTWLVPPEKRAGAYSWIENQIINDCVQAFIVCPIIEESDKETMQGVKAATEEYQRLKKQFKKIKLGLLHGRMKNEEKQKVIDDFRENKFQVLVSTPVVEVGIDIPNATIMMIEASDRFGLAQLHQLRGRVGRGNKKSYCLLFTEAKSQKVNLRLKAMTEVKTGRELAEIDLKTRGPGEVFGVKQHGYGELKIADWSDIPLIKKAKKFADEVVENQKKYRDILNYFKSKQVVNN